MPADPELPSTPSRSSPPHHTRGDETLHCDDCQRHMGKHLIPIDSCESCKRAFSTYGFDSTFAEIEGAGAQLPVARKRRPPRRTHTTCTALRSYSCYSENRTIAIQLRSIQIYYSHHNHCHYNPSRHHNLPRFLGRAACASTPKSPTNANSARRSLMSGYCPIFA